MTTRITTDNITDSTIVKSDLGTIVPIWMNMFRDPRFKDTKFVLHHKHSAIKFKIPENVEIQVYS